jgi:hypothetical protein
MIAGIKLVRDISASPYISNEDKVKALDDLLSILQSGYTGQSLCNESNVTIPFNGSKLGVDFWRNNIQAKL